MQTHDAHARRVRLIALALAVVAFIGLIGWGTQLVRVQMLENAQQLGIKLARSYAGRELARLGAYEMFLGYGATGLNNQIDNGAGEQTMQSFLVRFASGINTALGNATADPYVVIGGRIVAANPWVGDESYDYRTTGWYRGAIENEGKLAVTDAYTDAITGERIVTVSIALHGEGNVLAFDIPVEDLSSGSDAKEDGVGYVLFDSSDNLLACSGTVDTDDPRFDEFLETLLIGVDEGTLEASDAVITGPDGNNLSVFYSHLDSGWLSVVTIPTSTLLIGGGVTPGFVALAAFCLVLVGIAVIMLVRERRSARAIQEASDTVRILGNTYFAIYRINYLTDTYTTIKSSSDTAQVMGSSGTQDHFMDVLRTVVEQSTFDQFAENFSSESIRKREAEGVIEYGGRYLRRFGDEYRWVSVSSITNDEIGNGEAIICFRHVDGAMREEMQRQELLESALETAHQATRRQHIFFSNISHDMRTPLNAIINLTKMARESEGDTQKIDRYLGLLEEAGVQLETLVNDVLDMSQIEYAEQTVLDLEPMDLMACAATAVDLVRAQAEREGKHIELTACDGSLWVKGDERRLGQILNNLVSNALKYSLEGARVDVRVGYADQLQDEGRKTRLFRIEVADTGIGMTQEFLERIFDPFARETMFAPSGVVGTGLGMPIVKSLVQQMGGEITVQSELGVGSTFTLTIPFEVVEAPRSTEDAAEPSSASASRDEGALPSFKGRCVLVAEDNPTNLLIVETLLGALEVEVTSVTDGSQAVDAIEKGAPGTFDAILMDMQMPVMDGCTAARAIRAVGRADTDAIPIIAVTANAFAEDAAAARSAGMTGYVTKPIDIGALAAALEAAWNG